MGRVLPEVSNVRTSILAVLVAAIGLLAAPWSQAPAAASWSIPDDLVAIVGDTSLQITFTTPSRDGAPNTREFIPSANGTSSSQWAGDCTTGAICTLTIDTIGSGGAFVYDKAAAPSYSIAIRDYYDDKGNSEQSNSFTVSTRYPRVDPPSITRRGEGITSITVNVTSSGETTYLVARTNDSEPGTCSSGDSTSSSTYTLTGLQVATEYSIWACSTKPYHVNSEWTGPLTISTEEPIPDPFSISEGEYGVRLRWRPVTGADSYQYRYRENGSSGSWTEVNTGSAYYGSRPGSAADFLQVGAYTPDVDGDVQLKNGVEYEFEFGTIYDGVAYWGENQKATPFKNLTASNFRLSTDTREYDGTRDVDVGWIDFDITGFIDGQGDPILDGNGDPLVVTFDGDGGDGGVPKLSAPDGSPAFDEVQLYVGGDYADADVGTGKDVVLDRPVVKTDGPNGSKYSVQSIVEADRTVTADITARPLNLSAFRVEVAGGDARVYDGTTAVADEAFSDDRVAGDDVTFSYTLGELPDKNVGTDKPVQFTDIAISGGADAGNYDLQTTSGTALVDVTARPLNLSAFAADDKVYDATTDVVNDATTDDPDGDTYIPGGSTFADDRVNGDELTYAYDVVFADTEVGSDISVDFSNITVSGGVDAGNYDLQTTSGSTTADITRRPVHLGGTRVYDATRLVDVADLAIVDRDVPRTGLIVGQSLVLEGAGSIAAKQVGTGLPIELSQQETDPGLEPGGGGPTDGFEAVEGAVGITLADGEGGGLASNYTLTGGTHLFAVTPKPMTVSGLGAATRVYDGTTAVTLSGGTLVGTVPGDTVTLLGAGAGTAAAPTVGTHGVAVGASLGGADAGNYALSQPSVSVTFTTRQLSVEGLRVVSRPYDGGRRATLSGGRLVNVAPAGSGVTLTGATVGTYASPNAGTHTVAVSLGLSGPDAGNYALSPVSLSGSIVPAEARLRVLGGLTQLLGSVGLPSFGTEPPGLDGLTVEWLDGAAPSGPGSYLVVASLRGGNYVADPLTRTVTVLPAPADERVRGTPVFGPQGIGGDGGGDGTSDGGAAGTSGAAGGLGSLPGLEPGESLVLVDGVPAAAQVGPEPGLDGTAGLGVSAGDVAAWFATRTADGADLPLGPEAELVVTPGGQLRVRGTGFQPRTTAEVWVFSEPRFLGTVPVGDDGTFAGEFPVAPDLEVGVHTAQLTGATPDGSVRAVNLGLRVLAADDPQFGLATSDMDGDAETARDRVEIVTTGSGPLGGDAWLLLALLGAALGGWWFLIGRRRRDEDEEELEGAGAVG